MRILEVEIPAGGADRFGSREGASEAGIALSPLGLVVSEHADKIGCFKIAREYGLITPTDPSPIFGEGFACREVAWDE